MPLYEYRCEECGAEFERRLSFSESDNLPACPRCESARTHKRLSRVVTFVTTAASSGASVPDLSCGPGSFS